MSARNGFVFYKSFLDAMDGLPDDLRLRCYDLILHYGIHGDKLENDNAVVECVFQLVKPIIDINNQRYENGKKGGRPKKSDSAKPAKEAKKKATKQVESKLEKPEEKKASSESTAKAADVVKLHDYKPEAQKKVEPYEERGEFGNVLLTNHDYVLLVNLKGKEDTDAAIKILDDYMESLSEKEKRKYRQKNHRQCMYNWVFPELEKRKRQQAQYSHNNARNFVRIGTNYSSEELSELEKKLLEN